MSRCSKNVSPEQKICVDTIKNALIDLAKNYGYQHIRYVFTRRADYIKNEDTFGFYVSSFPAEFEGRYNEAGYIKVDPLMRFTQDSTSPTYTTHGTWQGVKAMALATPLGSDAAEIKTYKSDVSSVYDLCDEYGIRDGVFVTIERHQSICWLSMGGDLPSDLHSKKISEDFWVELRHALIIIDDLMEMTAGCRHCHPGISVENKHHIKLSEKQTEILRAFFINPGGSIIDIAESLCVSESTVNYHLANIRSKLNMPKASGLALATLAHSLSVF